MKFAVVTFGCRVNQADSFGIERGLRAAGGSPVPVEAADVVVVNSCSVTATADQGTRQVIRRIARTNAGARIVATGCYASRAAEEVASLPGVVAVVPNVVFPYSDRPGTEATAMSGKAHGRRIRERARAVREARFRTAQVGSVRPGLTLAQAGGTVVLTDNHVRVRVPVERPENQRVRVRVTAAGETMAGELLAAAP